MRILFLAPQPFYIDRGTPIAIRMILQMLSRRGDEVDLVTYHRGKDLQLDRVAIHRIPNIPFIRSIPAGFSLKKVFCDILFLFKSLTTASRKQYHLVHAVEEAVFVALVLKLLFRVPYVYDMDSSLSGQMVDSHPVLFRPFYPLMAWLEGIAVRNAKVVVPVCDALYDGIKKHHPEKVFTIEDVSLLGEQNTDFQDDLRKLYDIQGPIIMYVGNLHVYQGIDLLLESFAILYQKDRSASLIIIGGKQPNLDKYRRKAQVLGIDAAVHFTGGKPVKHLGYYLNQADILVSPRVRGSNTPMKIYSYLDAGKPILATRLPTHTQVLNDEVALLAKPTAEAFAQGLKELVQHPIRRKVLGAAAKRLAREKHTFQVFQNKVSELYDWLNQEVDAQIPVGSLRI